MGSLQRSSGRFRLPTCICIRSARLPLAEEALASGMGDGNFAADKGGRLFDPPELLRQACIHWSRCHWLTASAGPRINTLTLEPPNLLNCTGLGWMAAPYRIRSWRP